jgi:methylthioribose-1-phosphate isomerase
MRIDGRAWRTIFVADDGWTVSVIDQTRLPFEFALRDLYTADDAACAIHDMVVRGAPLIGVTAAYGVGLAMRGDPSDGGLRRALDLLGATRPTAVNLRWALQHMESALAREPPAWPTRMRLPARRSARTAWSSSSG